MNDDRHQNLPMFLGTLWLVLAWRIAAGFGGTILGTFFAAFLAAQGVAFLIEAIRTRRAMRGPRPATRVPPLWLIAWGVIVILLAVKGAPHVSVGEYNLACNYVGWHGFVRTPLGFECPTVLFIRVT